MKHTSARCIRRPAARAAALAFALESGQLPCGRDTSQYLWEDVEMKDAMLNSRFKLSRRGLLQTAAGLAGSSMLPGLTPLAFAEDKPAVGTWPAGSSGSSVFIGVAVPRTGTYAVQGEDELKGWELAVEHINSGNELIKKMSPKTSKGVLGKELKIGVADSAAKPNEAVQAEQRFITENKAMLIT